MKWVLLGFLLWLDLVLVVCLDIWKKCFLKTCWHECSNAKINQACCDFESIKITVMLFQFEVNTNVLSNLIY